MNVAARIVDHARAAEVLVNEAVAVGEASPIDFDLVGPVNLKGVAGAVTVYAARSGRPPGRAAASRFAAD